MKLLVIGGTIFLGRHCVEAAIRRGHEVTLFFRGKHGAALFPGVERILGDRSTDINKLAGRNWDAVIDCCGYFPRDLVKSTEGLKDSVGRYCFISSISAYANESEYGRNEESPLATTDDVEATEITGENYGGLKAKCENVVRRAFGRRALVIRPGLIVGPNDISDRFTYWPVRFDRYDRVLSPNRREQPLQVIDVRDLAEWTIDLLEREVGGDFSATGPAEPCNWGDFMEECRRVVKPKVEIVWMDEEFLLENGVQPWSDLPMWLSKQANADGMDAIDLTKPLANGLKLRPMADTLSDTLVYYRSLPPDYVPRCGLSRQREEELIEIWQSR